jgi:SAM-dependent methyltransferase
MDDPSETLPPSPTIDRCMTEVLGPYALLAGMKLDVFTPLADGPNSAERLATRLGVRPERLRPLLFALAATGLLRAEGDGSFANAPEADHYLVRGRPHFLGDLHISFEDTWRGGLLAAEAIRAGRPVAALDFATMPADELAHFFGGQHPYALLGGWKFAEAVDLGGQRHVLDVGGGSGGLSIALCQRWPGLRATVVELPSVATVAERRVREAGLADRIDVVRADILAAPLTGAFDVAILRSLLQVLSPEDARTALRHVRPALAPGGALYVLGQILDDDRLQPQGAVLLNLVFLAFYEGGASHTEAEHREWLAAAGFVDVERGVTSNGLNMVTARAPSGDGTPR